MGRSDVREKCWARKGVGNQLCKAPEGRFRQLVPDLFSSPYIEAILPLKLTVGTGEFFMTNAQIASLFEQVADLLEFDGANPFRVRAYRNGSRTVKQLPESVASMLESGKQLTDVSGLGKDLAQKCKEIVETGRLAMLDELHSKIPDSVLALLRIPGLGPKKAAVLFKELKISSLEQLEKACRDDIVSGLKGFGAKTQERILQGLAIAEAANQRIYWSAADDIVTDLTAHLRQCEAVEKLELAGSYRRGKETVGDLDVLVVSHDSNQVMDRFAVYPGLAEILLRGETKMSVRVDSGLQIDLRVVPPESFGAALQYFTGSKEHNVVIRGLAKQRGLKINEYGVFRVTDEKEEYVAGASEEEIYSALDLPLFPPELREARSEFERAEQDALPNLVDLADIRGDLHMHTTETDGTATLQEMAQAAIDRGLEYIAITDHSKRVAMARGLDSERLLSQWASIDELNQVLDGQLTVLKGIECDILENGEMDLPDKVLAQSDWVVASIHYGQRQPRQQITDRIVGALENPYVSIIAHPTGRLINRREPYDVDLEAVFVAAANNGKLLELNANPARLDLNDLHCAAAKSHDIPIVISTDAHSIVGLDVLRFGILQARRGGLAKCDVANTRPWPELQRMLCRRQ